MSNATVSSSFNMKNVKYVLGGTGIEIHSFDTHNIQVELGGCQRSDDFIGDIFEFHYINESEVVVG